MAARRSTCIDVEQYRSTGPGHRPVVHERKGRDFETPASTGGGEKKRRRIASGELVVNYHQ